MDVLGAGNEALRITIRVVDSQEQRGCDAAVNQELIASPAKMYAQSLKSGSLIGIGRAHSKIKASKASEILARGIRVFGRTNTESPTTSKSKVKPNGDSIEGNPVGEGIFSTSKKALPLLKGLPSAW